MRVIIHPDAEFELAEAIAYYDTQRKGLGRELLDEFTVARRAISERPAAWTEIEPGIRKFVVNRFPYNVLYVVRDTGSFVVAIMHHKRRPGYWKERLTD
jgi:hypothetical protein